MKTIHLHIGNYKTGSTAIQHFLGDNREAFLKQGYYIPLTGFDGTAHHEWIWALRNEKMARPQEELYRDLRAEIEHCGYDHILASSEVFFNGLNAQAFQEAIGEDFQVRVICFLRRQDLFLSAFYQQMIKHWRYRITKKPVAEDLVKGPSVQYLESIKRWEEICGPDNIVVLPYEKSQMNEGLVVSFIWALQRDASQFSVKTKAKQVNTTIHRELLEFLRIANNVEMTKEEHEALLEVLSNISGRVKNSKFSKLSALSPQSRQDILDHFAEDNVTIARDYMGRADGRLFYDAPPDLDEEWFEPEIDVEDMAKIFVGLWLDIKSKVDGVSRVMDKDVSGKVVRRLLSLVQSRGSKS